MQHLIYTTAATVFVAKELTPEQQAFLKHDYHETYHGKRPSDPIISDKYIFLTGTDFFMGSENLDQVDKLQKITNLRSVNFIVIKDDVDVEPIGKLIRLKLKEWNNLFLKNSYNGSLTMSTNVQCFEAMLLEEHKVRGINRMILGLGI